MANFGAEDHGHHVFNTHFTAKDQSVTASANSVPSIKWFIGAITS